MANRSTFPESIDTFLEHYDIQASDRTNVLRYQTLKTKTTLTTSEQNELADLTTLLRDKIFTAEDFNKLQDCITNLETFFRDNVEGYIDTKQDEMESFVVDKQTDINAYVDNKKTEMTNYSDNTKALFDAKVNELRDKGEYNPTSQYYQFNIVSSNGNTYLAKEDTLGNPPTNTNYWHLMSRKGDKGDAGIGLTFQGAYDNNRAYNIDDAVSLDGVIYYCVSATIGNSPPNETYWAVFLDTSSLSDVIGDLASLNTIDKSNLVNAVNEVKSNLDNLSTDASDITIEDANEHFISDNVEGALTELFQYANDGKTEIANAITAKGILASVSDTFSALATKIGQILRSFGTATSDKVLAGYTFSNDTQAEVQGTMLNRGAVNQNLTTHNQEYTIPEGYHNGLGKIKAVITGLAASVIKAGTTVGGILGTFTSDATAVAADILSGKTAYKNGSKLTGTMVNRGTVTQTLTTQGGQYTVPAGYHTGSGKVTASFSNLSAGNIKNGVNVGGVVGNLIPAPTINSDDIVFTGNKSLTPAPTEHYASNFTTNAFLFYVEHVSGAAWDIRLRSTNGAPFWHIGTRGKILTTDISIPYGEGSSAKIINIYKAPILMTSSRDSVAYYFFIK